MCKTEDSTKEDRLMHRALKPFEFFEPKTVAEAETMRKRGKS